MTVSINGPLGTSPTIPTNNSTDGVGRAQPPAAHQPNPASILALSRQQFPEAPLAVLQGKVAYQPAGSSRLVPQIEARQRSMGAREVPIAIGSGENIRVAPMPTAGVAGPDVAGKIQRYVTEGQEIHDRVMRGEFQGTLTKHDVTRMMWFLQALASAKAAASAGGSGLAMFSEGAMCVSDPEGRLEAFLRNANSYSRSSSHFAEYQALGDAFAPRGVDVRNTETPNERKTVLFARLPTEGEIPAGGPPGVGNSRMLFIKMEAYGCRGLTPRGSGTPRQPGEPVHVWKGIKRFFLNARDLFQHGIGWIRSIGQRRGLIAVAGQNNRERIPADVKNAWNGMRGRLAQVDDSMSDAEKGMRAAVLATLETGNPLGSCGGIKHMLRNLHEATAQVERWEVESGGNAGDLGQQLDDLRILLHTHGDHPALRTGNEIILTGDDLVLGDVNPCRSWDGRTSVQRRHTMSYPAQAVIAAGLRYRLANIDAVDAVHTFQADATRSLYRISSANGLELHEIYQDAAASHAAVDDLAEGNERLAKVLKSFCHQGLPSDILATMVDQSTLRDGLLIAPGGAGRYTIVRASMVTPPLPDGVKQYYVGCEIDCQPQVFPLDGNVPENYQAHLTASTWLTITVDRNGAMGIDFMEPPEFAYSVTP